MDKSAVIASIRDFVETSPLNLVAESDALRPDIAGMPMYDDALVGVAAADDDGFEALRRPEAVGPHFRGPGEWLPGAKSVIAFFLPFSDRVVLSNRRDAREPSAEWMHARIEGQTFIIGLCRHLCAVLEAAGHRALTPAIHPDFISCNQANADGLAYTSNWSERHVGYVAGLGTFGLSSGFISRRGMAGRMGSVITDLALPADARPYSAHNEYCTMCGACQRRCPVDAISREKGRDKPACAVFLSGILQRHKPRYGCGKCQVAVPCERRAPGLKNGGR